MISRLRGTLLSKKPPYLLVEVQGIGYAVQAPMSTIFNSPELGSEIILHTEFVVREDAHKLYGFLTQSERELFNKVTKVSGVGPKIGLAILSGMTVEAFEKKIYASDVAGLVNLPGVGKKTAERLVIELRDKIKNDGSSLFSEVALNRPGSGQSAIQDAVSALVSLGYTTKDADQAMMKLKKDQDIDQWSSEQLIKNALAGLMKR